ncbi:hypothetical protein CRG98_011279 [Punica granatum]|uniref:Uncharacterized protein n=1 Tax=Punica granatum TaxID=22663 RepID=A0A2I0KIR6_PUNGR|nr:hypothetical protein CRG98_011279 [Punica granatum]
MSGVVGDLAWNVPRFSSLFRTELMSLGKNSVVDKPEQPPEQSTNDTELKQTRTFEVQTLGERDGRVDGPADPSASAYVVVTVGVSSS